MRQTTWGVSASALCLLSLIAAPLFSQSHIPTATRSIYAVTPPACGTPGACRDFWRPHTVAGEESLFGALVDFGRRADQDRILRSRGVVRPLNFHFKNFAYERDFFHFYRGIRLQTFLEGKLDLGIYKHRMYQGMLLGPAGAYRPSTSNRIELMLRWNLNDR